MRAGRHSFTLLVALIGIALSSTATLITVACADSESPTPDIQATIDASVRATVATYREDATPTQSPSRSFLQARTTPTPDVAAMVATAVASVQSEKDDGSLTTYGDKTTPTPSPSRSSLQARTTPTPDVSVVIANLIVEALESSQTTDQTLTQTYTAPSGLWSIRHPDGWESEVMNVAFSDRIVLGGPVESSDGITFAGISVETVNDDGLLSLDEITKGVILINSAILNDFHLLSRYTRAFQATVAEELLFSHESPLGPTTGVMIVVRSAVHVHTVQIFSLSSSFEEVEGQLRDILHSFRLL